METGALTKSANQFGGFLSSLLNKEKDYIEYLREERQRAFFVTSHSIVGTVRKPYMVKVVFKTITLVREDNIQKVNQEELK